MPLVRIDLVRGRTPQQIKLLGDRIHQALVEVMGIPERDRFQVITQHEPYELLAEDAGLGFERSANVVVIQITTQRGRDTNLKQRLFQRITAQLSLAGVAPNDVFISYVENGPDDWSFGFGRAQFVTGELTPYAQPGR